MIFQASEQNKKVDRERGPKPYKIANFRKNETEVKQEYEHRILQHLSR